MVCLLRSFVTEGPIRIAVVVAGLVLCTAHGTLPRAVSAAGEMEARSAIYANVASSIEIQAPAELQWADLVVGTNVSPAQRINVKSNKPYSLKMRSVTRTRMAEYDLTDEEFVSGGRSLSEALMWRFADDTYEARKVDRSDEVILAANPPTGDSGQNFDICFVQEIGYGDERLPEGRAYRIDIVFTAVQDV